MNIVGLVTARAVGRQLAAGDRRRMAGLAVDLCMLALQRPVTLLLVVIPSVFPLLFAMALFAIIAKPPATTTSSSTLKSKYDLNVEVNSDGTVHVVAPATNRPAAAP